MGVPSTTPPPVGTVGIGELLADAQTKTLWLGVSTSFDPQGSILVSDLVGLMDQDSDDLAVAMAYTDAGVATRAPTNHTHTIAQITGLQEELDSINQTLPNGVIIIWSGILADIPAGWALCNGDHGTPDLRDKFVMGGGGNIAAGSTGGALSKTFNTAAGGSHTHSIAIDPHVLTTDELPAHTHPVTDTGHTHVVTDPGHVHDIVHGALSGAGAQNGVNQTASQPDMQTKSAKTGITIANATTGLTVGAQGGGLGHAHTAVIAASPTHSHSIIVDVTPAYVNLGYIMKVP